MNSHQKILLGLLGTTGLFLSTTFAQDNAEIPLPPTEQPEVQIFPYQKTFTITAYYSPIEGQKRYIRGTIEADKKLNGNGTNGADGTPVFPGMIAAPKNIAFGTKMQIPNIGTVAVHDRGGAIVPAGEKGQTFDRLDVWMGQGDEGLNRALRWGRRNVLVTIYGQDASIEENIDLSGISSEDLPINTTSISPAAAPTPTIIFRQDFGLGDVNSEIKVIKQKLTDLKYYQGTITENFDTSLYQALVKFQVDYEIIDNENAFGAGYFGPQTRKTLEKALTGLSPSKNHQINLIPIAAAGNKDTYSKQVELAGNGLSFLSRDLGLGDSGQSVVELQTELAKLNLFGLEPTGNYGKVTAHAVFKFQQSQGLAEKETDTGAGSFGNITRNKLASLVNNRIEVRQAISNNSTK
jgi:peptidoglycan hydrolase-like protein with peptidoglycan-binding domain/3D (Asp-Asp-Asp) domain-containing protein